MKRKLAGLLAGMAMLLGSGITNASLMGQDVNAVAGGNLTATGLDPSAVVDSGIEFAFCINSADCTTGGLLVSVDIGSDYVQFGVFGSTGSINPGDAFTLELEFPNYAGSILNVVQNNYALTSGMLSWVSLASNLLLFEFVESGGSIEAATLQLARFDLELDQAAAAPLPGSLALALLALAGVGVTRRRAA